MKKQRSFQAADRQRGAVIILAALAISIGVILLSLADIGFMYYYKREYQKAADLAAMAGAKSLVAADGTRACSNAEPAAQANAGFNLGTKGALTDLDCGQWRAATGFVSAGVDDPQLNAVRAVVSGQPPHFLPFTHRATLSAYATAVAGDALARLTIRSTLATVDTEQSALLNGIVGGMLGGNINLPVAAWNGLLNTDINLLTFLDALAVRTGIGVGNYDQVLSAPIAVGQLLGAAIDALPNNQSANDADVALNGLLALPLNLPLITLGDLIGVDSNAPSSALDVPLNLLQLVQGGAQLANGNNVVAADLPTVGIPGIATVSVKAKVIENMQPSAIGNPALAAADPLGPDKIFVRTAQVRTLVSINLSGVTNLLNDLTSALSPLLNPIVNFLNSAGFSSFNLLGAVGDLIKDVFEAVLTICDNNCSPRNALYAEALSQPIQISLDAASAAGWVTDYGCGNEKSLETSAETSVAYLRAGTMSEADVFSNNIPAVNAAPIVELGYREVRPRKCFKLLGIGTCEDEQWKQENGTWLTNGRSTAKRNVLAGLGLKVDGPVGGSSSPTLMYTNPPEISDQPDFQDVPSSAVLNGLGTTLRNSLQPYRSAASGPLGGGLLEGTLSLSASVVNAVMDLLEDVITGLLDPILDSLLGTLGADLAVTDLGANLSCDGGGATLVD
ncbi:hypothetical protein [Sinimarinibacterium sp. NLF-5-8]|uniref:TadG family pilus assembly protein n=1 Tax=Sinimarinibacterium sp. NLF-5-8 TaxID=2698684 RepID=UPI00137C0ED9|nr:hypothetical protein [Sinimarinibacterium sp. NLF-5-8]QHS09976.1 hypothetical protein GT972_07365 [Sinimarinibacterium sp. NLF-5-8]